MCEIDCRTWRCRAGRGPPGLHVRAGAGAQAQHRACPTKLAELRKLSQAGWRAWAHGSRARRLPRPVDYRGLEESVALALERNLDIAVERLNPTAFDFSLAALRAQFNPTLTSNVGQNNT